MPVPENSDEWRDDFNARTAYVVRIQDSCLPLKIKLSLDGWSFGGYLHI